MEILLLLGLGFLLFFLGKSSGKSTPSEPKKPLSKKERDEEEFLDMMMALDDEDEMDGF